MKRQIRISEENYNRIENVGTVRDTFDSAMSKTLDVYEDVMRVIDGNEARTEEVKMILERNELVGYSRKIVKEHEDEFVDIDNI